MASMSNPIRKLFASPFVAGLLVSSCVFALCADDAMAQRGGGGRARRQRQPWWGGGGGMAGARPRAPCQQQSLRWRWQSRRRRGNSANRSEMRQSLRKHRQPHEHHQPSNNSSRNTNIGSNNNVNIDRGDVNIDVDGGYGNGCCRARYPVAAGVAIGAMAGMTAAAVGSYYYGLPSGCAQIMRGGIGYYQCGSAYYQQSMNGDQVVYVSVNP
jgi:hypothetical protein